MADMKPLTIWTVYHDDAQISEYGLKETDTRKLFGTHLDDMGRGISMLNPAWSELVAIFYIILNNLSSECVGINHYRRQFEPTILPKKGEACVYKQYDWGSETVADQFVRHHGKEAMDMTLEVLAKHGGDKYIKNLTKNHILVGNCCFVMQWSDFLNMSNWLFSLLAEIRDKLIGIPESKQDELKRWRDRAVRLFGEENADYQMRCIGFIGERLISAWIMENLTIIETAR